MSPSTPNDFIGSLVEMAEAYRELPKVQAELADARVSIDSQAATIQRLEMKLLDRSNELAMLHSRIRELEVSRDEAQFHALEADDRTQRALDFIKATFGNAGTLIQALEPPREAPAQPMDTTSAMSEAEGVSVQASPTASSLSPMNSAPSAFSQSAEDATSVSPPSIADSASLAPEVAASPGEPDATTSSVSVADAATTTPASSGADASSSDPTAPNPSDYNRSGPYAGKLYSEVVKSGHWPTRDQWEAGGGTTDNWFA